MKPFNPQKFLFRLLAGLLGKGFITLHLWHGDVGANVTGR